MDETFSPENRKIISSSMIIALLFTLKSDLLSMSAINNFHNSTTYNHEEELEKVEIQIPKQWRIQDFNLEGVKNVTKARFAKCLFPNLLIPSLNAHQKMRKFRRWLLDKLIEYFSEIENCLENLALNCVDHALLEISDFFRLLLLLF